jgi:hypothetical protein
VNFGYSVRRPDVVFVPRLPPIPWEPRVESEVDVMFREAFERLIAAS